MNLIIVATSLGFGTIPIVRPEFYHHFPAWVQTIFHSGISSSALMAITLNLVFNHLVGGSMDHPAAPERMMRLADVAKLQHGDHFLEGKLYDVDGVEVPLAGSGAH